MSPEPEAVADVTDRLLTVMEERDELRRRLDEANEHLRARAWRDESYSAIISWLRYPVIGFTVIAFLWIADRALNLHIQELTLFGVSLRATEKADSVLRHLQAQVVETQDMLKSIEASYAARSTTNAIQRDSILTASFLAAQDVTDEVAGLSRSIDPHAERTLLSGSTGFIWIGNREGGGWTKSKIKTLDGRVFGADPATIVVGDELLVDGNLVLRETAPDTGLDYFRSVRPLGVVPRGTRVVAMASPIEYRRPSVTQYWLRVTIR